MYLAKTRCSWNPPLIKIMKCFLAAKIFDLRKVRTTKSAYINGRNPSMK